MGRHGGGSRSGGSRSRSSSSRSHSGSRSRGSSSSVKSSKTPFRGCYNRSYYYRGRYHPYYTTDATFGTNSGFNVFKLIIAIFITIHMLLMLCTMGFSMISFGSKVDGNPDRIAIVDNIDILTPDEENKTLELLHDVYDKSGMPITIITDDFTWKDYYANIETYSEELYYTIGMDETAMVILFTQDDVGDFIDWEYDVYCGDDTVNCLSDETFDEFLDIFQKSMSKQDLYYALDYSWNAVIEDLAKTNVNPAGIPVLIFILCFYSIFYIFLFGGNRKKKQAAKYFKEHPEMLNTEPMRLYSECPNCGASNTAMSETCPYCGSILKLSDANVVFVKSK